MAKVKNLVERLFPKATTWREMAAPYRDPDVFTPTLVLMDYPVFTRELPPVPGYDAPKSIFDYRSLKNTPDIWRKEKQVFAFCRNEAALATISYGARLNKNFIRAMAQIANPDRKPDIDAMKPSPKVEEHLSLRIPSYFVHSDYPRDENTFKRDAKGIEIRLGRNGASASYTYLHAMPSKVLYVGRKECEHEGGQRVTDVVSGQFCAKTGRAIDQWQRQLVNERNEVEGKTSHAVYEDGHLKKGSLQLAVDPAKLNAFYKEAPPEALRPADIPVGRGILGVLGVLVAVNRHAKLTAGPGR